MEIEERYEDVCREYIIARYEEEGVIPKEIYILYKDIEKEKIDAIIREKCFEERVLYRIERPIKEKEKRRTESLYQTKQQVQEVQRLAVITRNTYIEKEYENVPGTVSFQIPNIREMSVRPIKFWKPVEIQLVEMILSKIKGMKVRGIENYCVIRGYFNAEYVNVIVMPEEQWREKRYLNQKGEREIERRRIQPNELGVLIDEIGKSLEEIKSSYRNKCKYMIVERVTWQYFQVLNRPIEFPRSGSNKCFLPIIGVEGIILEKPCQVNILGTIPTRNGTDILNQIKRCSRRQAISNRFDIRDFKTPIIRKKIIYRKKTNMSREDFKPLLYDRAVTAHILKWLRYETDKENFKRIFPSLLFNSIAARTDNPDSKYRKGIANKILEELDNIID